MTRAALGTALFALLGPPALAAAVVPLLLWRWDPWRGGLEWGGWRWLGLASILAGLGLVAETMTAFVRLGRGTPAPWAPPVHFVAGGLYGRTRNPMYAGILVVVVGEGLAYSSPAVLAWSFVLFLCFHAAVVLYEEPNLLRRFGVEYDEYRRQVPRWLPRLRA